LSSDDSDLAAFVYDIKSKLNYRKKQYKEALIFCKRAIGFSKNNSKAKNIFLLNIEDIHKKLKKAKESKTSQSPHTTMSTPLSVPKSQPDEDKEIIDQQINLLKTINENFKKMDLDETTCLNTITDHLERFISLLNSHSNEISSNTKLTHEYSQFKQFIANYMESNNTESKISGMSFEQTNQYIKLMNLSMQLPPTELIINYHFTRARLYLFSEVENRKKEALDHYNCAVEKANAFWPTERAKIYFLRALFYTDSNDFDKALLDLELARSLKDPFLSFPIQMAYDTLKEIIEEFKNTPLIDFLKKSRDALEQDHHKAIQYLRVFLYGITKHKKQLSHSEFKKELDTTKKAFEKCTETLLKQLKEEDEKSEASEKIKANIFSTLTYLLELSSDDPDLAAFISDIKSKLHYRKKQYKESLAYCKKAIDLSQNSKAKNIFLLNLEDLNKKLS